MTFNDRKYADSVWTPENIAMLEKSWEKQKSEWYSLINPLLQDDFKRVLDVGCGIGMYYDLFLPKCEHYIGIDPVKQMIQRAKERNPEGDWRTGSIYRLSFPNDHFDLVFCWSVLVHLPHETIEKAFSELWRVTKRKLFFNLYVSLDEPSFSEVGPWGELLTALDKMKISIIMRKMSPQRHQVHPYEPIDFLNEKRFQRYIYILEKKHA